MNDARQKGLALFREIYGDAAADGIVANMVDGSFGSEQSRWTLEWSFGEVWCREGLDRKLRSCAVLGMLIGQGQSDEIRYHTIMGLKNGLTRTEIEEIFYCAIPYAGFPAAQTAKRAMLAAFAQVDGEAST